MTRRRGNPLGLRTSAFFFKGRFVGLNESNGNLQRLVLFNSMYDLNTLTHYIGLKLQNVKGYGVHYDVKDRRK